MAAPTPPRRPRTFTISFGVTDIPVVVHHDGLVHIQAPKHLAPTLEQLLSDVLETWLIDAVPGDLVAETAVSPLLWYDYFVSRTEEFRAEGRHD